MIGRSTPTTVDIRNKIKSFKISGKSSALGMRSRSPGSYNSQQGPVESLSMGSKIFKEVMVREGLPSRRQAKLTPSQRVILGMCLSVPIIHNADAMSQF